MRLRKKSLPVVPLEETIETEDEAPKKNWERRTRNWPDHRSPWSYSVRSRLCRRGTVRFFVLHDVEGYEHNEIAGMVGCSIGNSKSQLHKARMKLRELLKTSRPGRTERASKP